MDVTISEDKPVLSVIMPVHHGERFISHALASVADQVPLSERKTVEVLVIEMADDSPSLEIARTFSDRMRLRVIVRPDLRMWHAKTNLGVLEATADHVCWLHQDDFWLPGRFNAVRKWIAEAPGAALHIAPSCFVDAKGASLGPWHCPFDASGPVPREKFLRHLLVQNFVAAPAPVFRKDAWLACGGLDETLWYTADWDIWLKLAGQGEAYFHEQTSTAFRVHGSSLTVSGSRDVDDFTSQLRIVLERHIAALSENARKTIGPLAETSVRINAALARAGMGDMSQLPGSLRAMISLGPLGLSKLLRDSRLVERVGARVRAKLRGSM
ncbi:glycosyltransferase [Paraburkholderia sp. LEh10]|uniref:glycosyltransferase n=1 Tax=Paraburkholderia sp. LEh10 TaxID=2821353 RepID=UPI001AE2949C|nr:glycosyltransferase [Paraburkholderia sp. LEh10]MBP0591589.1 glycosyltransferase [Paraburkholderia sp. LEh10]